MKRLSLSLLAAAALITGLAAAEPASPPPKPVPELPLATFFQSPTITSLTFSPNGKFIACLVPYEKRMNLAVIDLENGKKNLLTNFKDRQATQPSWASNDRILFRVDDDGKESFALYAVNRDGKDPTVLASGYSKADSNNEINVRFRSVLGTIEGDTKNILVLANLTYRDWSDVATLNLKTGAMTTVIEAPGNVDYYLRDRTGEVRIAVIEKAQIRKVLYRAGKSKSDWVTLGEHQVDSPGWEPLAFDGDNKTLFIWSDIGRKTKAIYRYDVAEKKQLDLVFADDTYDALDANGAASTNGFASNTIFDPKKNKIVGLSYAADRTRFFWIDEDMKKLHAKLEASLPDTVHRPRQFASDGSKIIFLSSNDRDPGVYYLFDRQTEKLNELAVIKPGIDPEKMAPMKEVTFTARDGLLLHGYLTIPRGPGKNLPLILHPHGGPYGIRDEWTYNDEVQYYANRGFAVLQVNYRGSGGYGREFEAIGFKKWGREMQDDLTDGVKWAIAQGLADPSRVVISGASYGGYATMAGLAFTPDLYCAGINYVGVTDIPLRIPRELSPDRMYWYDTRHGKLSNAADRQLMHDTSPVNFADRIKAPVLMAYGKNDPRVVIDHGYDMERALKKAGKSYEMIIEADEGHGFRMEERRIGFFTRVDAFLKKNVATNANVKVGPTEVLEQPAKAK